MENNLELFKNNSLLIDKYKDKIKTIEEGKERILEIKKDYEKVVEAVTERKFYLEGKTLSELRELHKYGEFKGTWELTYNILGYDRNQVLTLIKKYEIAHNIFRENIEEKSEKKLDNLEKLTTKETNQLEKLKMSEAQAILESENAKLELKKLREELKKQKELELENAEKVEVLEYEKEQLEEKISTILNEKNEIEDSMLLLESEISKLSKELNARPVVEKEIEKVVIKEIEKEVIPLDYVEAKGEVENYKLETQKKKEQLEELKIKFDKMKKDSELKIKELKFLQAVDGNGFKKMQHEITRMHTILREVKAIYEKAEAQNEITDYGRKAEKESLQYLVEKINELIIKMGKNEKVGDYIEIE